MRFQKELKEVLIPAVEGKYSTYAESTDDAGLKASRMHRGFGGFSMGGGVTWYSFTENLSIIGWFLPISGGCWKLCIKGDRDDLRRTAEMLRDTVKETLGEDPQYFIYLATGTEDIAYPGLQPFAEEMEKLPCFNEEHFRYHFEENYIHAYDNVCNYLRIALPFFFR